jgi:hypothetical protein
MMVERGESRCASWPPFDAAFVASAMRWLMLILGVACALMLVNAALRQMRWLPADKRSDQRSSR